MAGIGRIHDLLVANANPVIDKAEEPEKMIKQAVREMDENIREAKPNCHDNGLISFRHSGRGDRSILRSKSQGPIDGRFRAPLNGRADRTLPSEHTGHDNSYPSSSGIFAPSPPN